MPLFLPRVIEKKIRALTDVPDAHRTILAAWSNNLARGIYDSETQNDGEFIQRILIDVLGYIGSSSGVAWSVAKNQPVGSGNVDVALGNFKAGAAPEILAPFELKGAKTTDLDAVMAGRNKSPVQQAWEYAMDAKGAKWVLLSNYRVIRLYAVGYGRKDYEEFDLSTLTEPANYHRFQLLLSARNLLSGTTLRLLKDSEAAEKEVTEELYQQYKQTRLSLIEAITPYEPTPSKAVETAQTILDRVLFIAFAEDKNLLKKGMLKEAFTFRNPFSPHPVWLNFKGLFEAIDKGSEKLNIPGYNGGLFATNPLIDRIELPDEICGQLAELGSYDFDTEVSVNILGHVFEQSILDIEEIKKQLDTESAPPEDVGSKRRKDGIFYTPPVVTRYMVEQVIGRWLADRKEELGFHKIAPLTDEDYASIRLVGVKRGQKLQYNLNVQKHIKIWEAYRDRLSKIRIIDPACGSGAFLNEIFDFLYREGQIINRTLETLYGGQINLFRWDTHILANNIFGVDINRESVEITKLSLWLKTANRNEKLSYLDDNIKTGNSLIRDSSIAGDLAFDWAAQFPQVMEDGGFDVVLANPPYVDSEAMAKSWARERDYLTENFQQTRGNWDLYIAFMELGCNLMSGNGYLSYITPDKWISKAFGTEMRRRLLPGLISILPLGRDVFESALVDSIITVVSARPVERLQVLALAENQEVVVAAEIEKAGITGDDGFDSLLSPQLSLLQKIDAVPHTTLGAISAAENACATSDAYALSEIMLDLASSHGYDPTVHYKIANTGTLSPYTFRWGSKPMRYDKRIYYFPVVTKDNFAARLGATYRRRAASPKVMIKGLTLLHGALDLDGAFVPGKTTLVICNQDAEILKLVVGIVNSRPASFYVRNKYASASYNGGVVFKPEMVNSIPVPDALDRAALVGFVDKIIAARTQLDQTSKKIHAVIRASGEDPKLRRRLYDWHLLDTATFLRELQAQGLKLTVRNRPEWVDLFDRYKNEVQAAYAQLVHSTKAIDDAIATAYGLNDAEKAEVLI
ncbi:N-6 DNA methylase [Cereibacter sphaeroides]|uniref:Eco57I restriction-modification methylase domain-containing protein n=1 Tax=Cereibacter sphaeroides TaxID=1063 RepID=UPI001F487704|nr:DNA methyltransferase [Cereibacter sphaeroides]MCE6949542.1 N-6 DNA methylase [Cereibacter sphaeroides]